MVEAAVDEGELAEGAGALLGPGLGLVEDDEGGLIWPQALGVNVEAGKEWDLVGLEMVTEFRLLCVVFGCGGKVGVGIPCSDDTPFCIAVGLEPAIPIRIGLANPQLEEWGVNLVNCLCIRFKEN